MHILIAPSFLLDPFPLLSTAHALPTMPALSFVRGTRPVISCRAQPVAVTFSRSLRRALPQRDHLRPCAAPAETAATTEQLYAELGEILNDYRRAPLSLVCI